MCNVFIFSDYKFFFLQKKKFHLVFLLLCDRKPQFFVSFMATIVLNNNNKDKQWKMLFSIWLSHFFSFFFFFLFSLSSIPFFKHIKIHYTSFSLVQSSIPPSFFSSHSLIPQIFLFVCCMKRKKQKKNQFSILLSPSFVLFYFYLDNKEKRKFEREEEEDIIGSPREVLGWEFDSLCWCAWVNKREKKEKYKYRKRHVFITTEWPGYRFTQCSYCFNVDENNDNIITSSPSSSISIKSQFKWNPTIPFI